MRRRGLRLVAVGLLLACGGGGEGDAGPWQFSVDSAGAGGGGQTGPTAWLRSVGREGAPGKAATDTVILSFDCVPGTAATTVMTRQALRQGSVEARLTLDSLTPRRVPAFAGTTPTGGQVVLTISQDSMLALLDGHTRATVEYEDGAGSSKTIAVFPVQGIEQHREAFLAACARSEGGGR